MKKFAVMMLVGLMALTLFACGSEKVPETSEPVEEVEEVVEDGAMAGGWTIADADEAKIPEEAKKALEDALEGYTGAGFTVIAYLGSQVVSGTNYAFLCKETLVTANPVTKLSVVKVYKNLDGKAEILSVNDYDVAKDAEAEGAAAEGLVGGWNYEEAVGAGIKDECKKAFDQAMEGILGVDYEPLACLGTQVVAGVNYAVLCKATTVTAEPVTKLSVVTVYANLEGNAEVLRIGDFVME